jgi:hypothetical protein
LLAALGDGYEHDAAVSLIVNRLLMKKEPEKALPWLARFREAGDPMSQTMRAQVAVKLADKDLKTALETAESLTDPLHKALALARLATSAKVQPQQAHDLIDRAAALLVANPTAKDEYDSEPRLGVAVYLLWQAKAVKHPDLPSLVALALAARAPTPAGPSAADTWRSNTLRLAAGAGSVDPAAGRAVLGPDPQRDFIESADAKEYGHDWLTPLALIDPALALKHLPAELSWYEAEHLLTVLKKRSSVVATLGLLDRMGWVYIEERPVVEEPD